MSIVLSRGLSTITLEPCSWTSDWQEIGGVFAFVNERGAQLKVLFVGETANFAATMRDSADWVRATNRGATSVYAARVDGDRAWIVAELVARYRPDLQSSNAGDADEPYITGINGILDAMTSPIEKNIPSTGVNDILDEMFAQAGVASKAVGAPEEGKIERRFRDQGYTGPNRRSPSFGMGLLGKLNFGQG